MTTWKKPWLKYRQHVPNLLTIIRCYLVLAIVDLYQLGVYEGFWGRLLIADLFALAAVTDYYDGKWARKWGCESMFGKIMDPISDRTLIWTGFMILWWRYPGTWDDDLRPVLLLFFGFIAIYDAAVLVLELAVACGVSIPLESRPLAKFRSAALQISLIAFLALLVVCEPGWVGYAAIVGLFACFFTPLTILASADYLLYACSTLQPPAAAE